MNDHLSPTHLTHLRRGRASGAILIGCLIVVALAIIAYVIAQLSGLPWWRTAIALVLIVSVLGGAAYALVRTARTPE